MWKSSQTGGMAHGCSGTHSERAAQAEESYLKFYPVLKPTWTSTQIFNQIQHRGGDLNRNKFLRFSQKRQKGLFYQTLGSPLQREPYKCIPTGKNSTGRVNSVDNVNVSQSQNHTKMGFISFSAHRNSFRIFNALQWLPREGSVRMRGASKSVIEISSSKLGSLVRHSGFCRSRVCTLPCRGWQGFLLNINTPNHTSYSSSWDRGTFCLDLMVVQ